MPFGSGTRRVFKRVCSWSSLEQTLLQFGFLIRNRRVVVCPVVAFDLGGSFYDFLALDVRRNLDKVWGTHFWLLQRLGSL